MKKTIPGFHAKTGTALRLAEKKHTLKGALPSPETLSPEEVRQTLHELRTHQIELEMQNEELRRVQGELDAARERYFDLYDLAPVGYCSVNEADLILESNLTASTLLGVARHALVGQPFTRSILKEDRDAWQLCEKKLFKSGEPAACELRMVKAGHPKFWVRLDITSARESDGTAVCRIVMTDITARKQSEAAMLHLEARLRQDQKLAAIGILAGGVAHEINNPLTCVINLAQLTLDRLPPNETKAHEYCNEIIIESKRIAGIICKLLAFSHHEKTAHCNEDLGAMTAAILSLTGKLLAKEGIALSMEIPPGLPPVSCSSPQIQQVLHNLLTNARDALNERFPGTHEDKRIHITAHTRLCEDGPFLRITFKDQGNGIPPSLQDRIFEPFFKTKDQGQGFGLGLSISYGIAQDHGGRLSFETWPGEGTAFHLDLPIAGAADPR